MSSASLFTHLRKALTGGRQGQCLVQESSRAWSLKNQMNVLVLLGISPDTTGKLCFSFRVSVSPSVKRTCWIRGTLFPSSSDTINVDKSMDKGIWRSWPVKTRLQVQFLRYSMGGQEFGISLNNLV